MSNDRKSPLSTGILDCSLHDGIHIYSFDPFTFPKEACFREGVLNICIAMSASVLLRALKSW